MRIVIVGIAALLIAACQPQSGRVNLAGDEKVQITKSVWDNYQEYLQTVGNARGAFVVTENGVGSAYSYCPVTSGCYRNINYSKEAIRLCENDGVKCLVFARDSRIVVEYEIVD